MPGIASKKSVLWVARVEDVTTSVSGALMIGSIAWEAIVPHRRWRIVSLLMLVAAGVVLWTRIRLLIGGDAAGYLDIAVGLGWLVLLVKSAPAFVREVKAAARE